MVTSVNLPLYNIEDDFVYINGKKITNDMSLRIKKLTTEKYNIDFLIQFGNNANYNSTDITVEGASFTLTSLPGEFGTDRKVGKHKLLQIVKVGDIESFTIKLTGGVSFNIKVELVTIEDTDIYLPNLKTPNDISFFPNGAAEYPVSNFDIPLPIALTQYRIGWTLNNTSTELPSEGLSVNIYYNTELFNITNLENNGDSRSINHLLLELDESIIKLKDITVPTFTTALVFEFVNEEGVILSTRSITLVRTNLYLVDEFDRIINTFYLPRNLDINLTKEFNYSSRLPDTKDLVTPYVEWVNNNVNNGFSNLVKSIVDIQLTDENNTLTLTKKNDYTGYDLRFTYKNPSNYYTLRLLVRNILIDSVWMNIATEEQKESAIVDIEESQLVMLKYQKDSIKFTAKNIAKLKLEKQDGEGEITTNVTYDNSYTVELPHNGKKVYPDLSGTITFDCISTTPGDYIYKVIALDCEDTELTSYDVHIKVNRPEADIDTDFETTKSNMDIDKEYIIDVECENVYEASIKEKHFLNFTAEITNVSHSEELLESGVYANYSFKLKITPKKVGVGTLTLVLKDDQDDVFKEYVKTIYIYTTQHTATRPNGSDTDIYRGLNPRWSYTKKYKYNIPLAFINNGDVADYILVAKYPIPQTDKIYKDYSKAFKNRLQLIKENKLENETIGDEGGEYYNIINKDIDKRIVSELTKNNVLNNKAIPIVNSSHIDNMLANITDISYYGIIENNKDDIESNRFANFKGINPNKDGFSPYPENPLNLDKHNGGTWDIKSNGRSITTYYGMEDNSLDTVLDSKNYPLLPMISSSSHLSHNGQANGIIDPYNMGIKIYHDIKMVYDVKNGFKLQIVDPYSSTQSNTDERTFRDIQFTEDQFIESINKAYIEPNDYPIGIKSRTFSGVEYWKNNNIALLDSAGIPYDNMVIEHEDDDSFKGNKGYREDLHSHRYGDSLWCNDLDKIKKLNKNTEAYYVSGGSYDNSLVKVFDETNSNTNHIINRYPEYSKDMNIGYRNRLLLESSVNYNVNKNEGYKNDHLFYNYRVSFLIFDQGIKNKTKLNVSSEWLLLEKNKTYPFEIISDGDIEIEENPNISINLNDKTVTANEISEGSFTIKSSKSGKEDNIRVIEYKIIETLPLTKLEIDNTNIEGFESQVFTVNIDTEDNELEIESDNPVIYNISQTSYTPPYSYTITLLRKGNATLTVKAKVDGKSANIKTIDINIKSKVMTKYELSNNSVSLTRDEAIGSLASGVIMKNITINHNLTSPYELGVWSTDLKNKRFTIDNDMKISIDLGNPTNGKYTFNYVAQSGGIFKQSNLLSDVEPTSSVEKNPNSIVRGTFTINIVDTDTGGE